LLFKAIMVSTQTLNKSPLTTDDSQLAAYNQAVAIAHLARGLKEVAVGLRATYALVEEVKGQLSRGGRP